MSRMGLEVCKLRMEKGLTQKQLGKMMGVSESYITDIESGKKVLNGELTGRLLKILGQQEDKFDMLEADEKSSDGIRIKTVKKPVEKPVQQVWTDALGSILKAVPVFDYKMDKSIDSRQLPVVSNKIEGQPKDKVFYIKIDDNDMLGFRISKGDLALCCMTQEIERDGIYFLEYEDIKAVRQVRKLEGRKILLISNKGSLVTETVTLKDIKVIAHLIKLEIML